MKPYLLLFAATLLLAAEIPCDYTCTHLSISVPIQKYVDSLPMPTVLSPSRRRSHNNEYDYYEITMRRGSAKMHRDLPEVPIFGYGGSYPGPSIEAHKGRPVVVKWVNEMYPPHIIETDDVMDFSMAAEILGIPKREITPTRAVVHLHGGRTANDSDGLPLAFYGPHGEANGGRNHRVYRYENQQRSALLFYHDHAIGITRTNVYAGLAGLYIIRDDEESNANLPEGQFEIPLLIQDKVFKYQPSTKGRKRSLNLFYPRVWVPEFFGDVIVVNGKIWPYLEVQPRKYRLRIVNGSDSRFYHLSFIYEDSSVTMPLSEDIKIPFELIGLEQGLLDSPVTVTSVLIAPAERMDIIVDFTNHHSRNILLFNDAPVPFTVENFPLTQEQIDEATSNGAFPDLCGTAQIMQFKVKRCTSAEVVPVPITLPDLPPLDVTDAHERTLFLNEVVDANDNPVKLLLNNKEFLGNPLVTDFVQYGTTELWHLINFTPDNHPIHPHLVEFKVLYRRPFTPGPGEFEVTNIGAQVAPDETEGGYKDTVKVPPGMITTIAARFNKCGRYVWHCHILSHEENDMMNFYEVINCP